MAAAKGGAVQISKPRIEEHPALVVAGVSQVFPLDGDFSSLWDELNQKASPAMLDVLNVTQYLGVCTQPNPKRQGRYTAGFLVSEPASAAKLGLGVLELPASTYAVVEVTGPISESIPAGFASFEEAFFAKNPQYRPVGGLEVYGRGDMQAADYRMELWVPLAKRS